MSQDTWDTIKGLFRRTTQRFQENYSGKSKTVDAVCDKATSLTSGLQKAAGSTVAHAEQLCALFAQTLDVLESMRLDWAEIGGQGVEDLGVMAKRMEALTGDMRIRVGTFRSTIVKEVSPLRRFRDDCDKLEPLLNDRKTKMLEFDFFRNKLASLRADPPSDTSRIPRNEGRVEEFRVQYNSATERVVNLCNQLNQSGVGLMMAAARSVSAETGKLYDEVGRMSRAVLLQQPPQQQVATAMAHAQAMAQQAASTVKQNLSSSNFGNVPAAATLPSPQQQPQAAAGGTTPPRVGPQETTFPPPPPQPSVAQRTGSLPPQSQAAAAAQTAPAAITTTTTTPNPPPAARSSRRFAADENDNPFRV